MAESKKNDNMNIDEMFVKIEEQIALLEKEDISLEDSLSAYEEGMKYIKSCNEAINNVEQKILIIRENGDTDEL